MKKILLLLLTLISVQGFAQLARTAQFDFAHPNSLTPSISNATYHGAWTMVTEKTFTDGLASISFDYNNAEIDTWNPTENNPSYYLSLSRGTYMVISVTGGCTINKVTINKNSSDAVYLLADRGSYNSSNGIWTPGSNSYHQVGLYYTSSQAPIIYHVQVEYSEPNEVLSASVSPGPEERPSTFSQLSLYYSNAQGAMSVQSQSGITISGAYDDPAHGEVHPTLSASASGNSVYLTCTPILVHDGTFTINIPAGAFRDAAGYENTALTTTVTVRENRATFVTTAVVVQKSAEEYTSLNHCDIYTFPEEIILEFSTNIGHLDTEKKFRLFREGTSDPVAQMKLAPVEGENKKAKLVFHSKSEDTFAKGVYHITVDQKVIYNSNYEDALYERYNPEFALTFNYKEAPDPLKGKKDEVAALKTEAAELYAKMNTLGYPKADDATNPLSAVKDQEVATTEDALDTQISNLKAAIKAFYDATDVVLPVAATSEETGWYTITSVAEGSELPLHYSNGAVTVGGTATAFQIESITDEGVIVLKTKDSKYLHVLTPATASTTTSAKNVTDSYMEAVNKLTIQKLKLAGDDTDQKPVAGLFTIKGSLGRDGSDNLLGTPTALVAHPAGTILTSTSDNTLYFATDKSSGFRFVSTTRPTDEPVTPPATSVSPRAYLSGSELDSNTKMLTLIIYGKANFDDITTVALNSNPSNDQKPYFVVKNADNSEGSVVTSFTGTAILEAFPESGYGNYFKVHVNGLEDGNYYLILPVGTFDYSGNANTVIDERMRVDFKIQSDSGSGSGSGGGSGDTSGFKTDLAQVQPYSTSPYFDGDVAVNPTVLNDFRVYSYKREGETEQTFFADTEKKVILAGYFNSQEYHQGHLEFDPTYNSAQVWCYKIVWEPAITEEDFHSSEPYNLGIKILGATLGDKNFKAWLDNPSSISKENCHVNREFVTFVKVDYNVPTEADKAGLSQTIAEAEAYHLSIKASHPSIAKTLEDAIDTAKNKLENAASTKRILALAKQALEAAIEAAKQAIATGIEEMEVSGGVEGATYYTLDGCKLDGKPTKKGVYIVNGRKVVIK